jgi:putative hydrolase of the HAD superfamily
MYRAVIFDLFGTLVPPFNPAQYNEALKNAARASNLADRRVDDWLDVFHGDDPDYWDRPKTLEEHWVRVAQSFGVRLAQDHASAAAQVYAEGVREALSVPDAVIDMLDRTLAAGIRVGLISNCGLEVPRLWASLPWTDRIEAPVFSCSVGMAKPEPQIFLHCLQMLGVHPEETVFVDDSSDNVTAAQALSMNGIWVAPEKPLQAHGTLKAVTSVVEAFNVWAG